MASELDDIRKKIFEINTSNFEELAITIFNYQFNNNILYQQYCQALQIDPLLITSLRKIPFLPIQFFKTKKITSSVFEPEIIFESSGTTGSINSKHLVKDASLYEESFLKGFELFYGNVSNYCIIGLLPSYLQRKNSSLVFMVNELIKRSDKNKSGFYLYDHEKLQQTLLENEKAKQPTLLIGVTYALLDFAEAFNMNLQYTTVMETGGMKGRRTEMTREEVHQKLKQQLGINEVHSEYGMTELLSQAYAKADGIFEIPAWMKIVLRAEDDPFELKLLPDTEKDFTTGIINVIDLANLNSCSFLATDDAGKLYKNGSFEVIGRLDNSDLRGCGLMII